MSAVYSWLLGGVILGAGVAIGVLARRLAQGYEAALGERRSINSVTFLRILRAALSRRGWSRRDVAGGMLMPGFVVLSLWLQSEAGLAAALAAGLACSMLWCLAVVDARTGLLPDVLTLSLLGLGVWIGPILAWEALLAAALAYFCARVLAGVYYRLRGHYGMGGGDIKLMAALAAWTGGQALIWIVLCASLAGVLFAMGMQRRWVPHGVYPFGPFLALAATPVLVAGGGVQSWF